MHNNPKYNGKPQKIIPWVECVESDKKRFQICLMGLQKSIGEFYISKETKTDRACIREQKMERDPS